jgi:hypothetical protein
MRGGILSTRLHVVGSKSFEIAFMPDERLVYTEAPLF